MLRVTMIAAVLALAGASAQAADMTSNPPRQTAICLDVGGQTLPVVCRVPGSRLDKREDFCSCPEGSRTEVAVCAKGQRPPADGLALDKVRRLAAKDGSLLGDTFEGKPICVAPRGS